MGEHLKSSSSCMFLHFYVVFQVDFWFSCCTITFKYFIFSFPLFFFFFCFMVDESQLPVIGLKIWTNSKKCFLTGNEPNHGSVWSEPWPPLFVEPHFCSEEHFTPAVLVETKLKSPEVLDQTRQAWKQPDTGCDDSMRVYATSALTQR